MLALTLNLTRLVPTLPGSVGTLNLLPLFSSETGNSLSALPPPSLLFSHYRSSHPQNLRCNHVLFWRPLDGPLKRRITSSSTPSSQLERTLPFQPEWLAIINLLFHTTTKPHLLSFTVSKTQ